MFVFVADKTIVPLRGASSYINATFINVSIIIFRLTFTLCMQGYREKKAFIIAQSPMENTVRDFWKMIVDYKVSAIVMLCGLKESGKVNCCIVHIVDIENDEIIGVLFSILAIIY